MNRMAGWGAICALLAVALGAFGAHGLEGKIEPDLLETYETGVRYHMFHALGLFVVAAFAEKRGWRPGIRWAGRLMLIGIVIFSGSLYLLALTGVRGLGAITPIGGFAFLGGWLLLALAAFKPSNHR